MIFVDTGVWFARFVPDDSQHSLITTWFETNTQLLVTSDYCIDEALTLLAARSRPKLAIKAGRHFFEGNVARLHFLREDQIHRAWILFQQRAAAGWSFTDCTSKIVIEDLELQTAATFDQHFHQFGVSVLP